MQNTKKLPSLLLILLSIIAFFLSPTVFADKHDTQQTTINLGIDYWPGYYPAVIAKNKGFFAKQGLNVNIKIYSDTNQQLNDFKTSKLDGICSAAGDIIPLSSQPDQHKIVLITDISSGGDAIIANKPYSKNQKKLSIGIDSEGFGELFVDQFIEDYQLNKNDITLINIDPTKAHQVLTKNRVDMVHTWDPHLSEAVNNGAKIIFTSRQTPGFIPDVLTFREPFLRQNPKAAQQFIKAWFEGLNWWMNNKNLGNEIISKNLKLTEKIQLKNLRLMTLEANIKSFNNSSPRSLPTVLNSYAEFFYNKGTINKKIKISDLIDGSYLPLPTIN